MKGFARRTVAACLAAGVAVSLLGGSPAAAASQSGNWGCAGQFAYLATTTTGKTTIDPPGSVYVWNDGTGGTRTRQATYQNGEGKLGGGSWMAGGVTVRNSVPSCSFAGL